MKKLLFYLLLISFSTFFFSCNTTDSSNQEFSGKLISATECKSFAISQNSQIDEDTPANLDCFEYSFSNGILKIKHINSGFNCCPGKLSAEITKTGNSITISEKEENAQCHCNCLYDFEYEFYGLAPQIYHIKFIEPYKLPEEPILEKDIDLSLNTQGKFCVERNHYPWIK